MKPKKFEEAPTEASALMPSRDTDGDAVMTEDDDQAQLRNYEMNLANGHRDDHQQQQQQQQQFPPVEKTLGNDDDIVNNNDNRQDSDEPTVLGEDDDNDDEDAQWKALVVSGVGPDQAPNLAMYMGAKSCRERAKEQFSAALDECMANLTEGVTEMLQDLVVPVHEEQRERFDAYEDDIIATMTSNHERRKVFQESLERADLSEQAYAKFRSRGRSASIARDY